MSLLYDPYEDLDVEYDVYVESANVGIRYGYCQIC